jgi:hypothetical protein
MGKTTKIVNLWPYVLIFFVWAIFSFRYFFNGLIPFPSRYLVSFFPPWNAYYGMPVKNNAMPDIITQIFPWKKLTIDSWKNGEIPLWNPYSFSGTAHGGNYQSAIFSPINVLFFIFPFIHAWSLSVLLQPLLAGVFMCMFLRSLKRSRPGAVLGSLAFMFCGFITVWMGYQTLGWAIVFLPLSLFAAVKYTQSENWWHGILLSLSTAASLFSGHYQISLYFLFALVIFSAGFSRKKLKLLFFVLFGVLLSSNQILLTIHSFIESNRASSFTSGAIPWKYLITLFSPDFYGNPVTRNDWFGQYAEWASYVGVIPLNFAILALLRKHQKEKLIFIALFIISLLFAMETPFNWLIYQLRIPVLSTSVATRMIVLASFSLAVLSSFGFDELRADWNKKLIAKFCLISLVVLGYVFIVGNEIAKRNSILPAGLLLLTVILFIAGLKLKKFTFLMMLVLIGGTMFEMLRFSLKWMPFDPYEYVYPNLPVITFIQKRIGNYRVFGGFGNELATYYQIPSIEGYDAMYQKRYGEFISAAGDGTIQNLQRSVVLIDKQGIYTSKWFDLLGVKYLLYRKSDGKNVWTFPHWEYSQYKSVYEDEKYEILENTNVLPRVFLVDSYKVVTHNQKIIDALTQTDLSSTVILEEEPDIMPAPGDGLATIVRYTPNSIDLRIETTAPKLLFLSDVFDPGWNVDIDGKGVKLLRANYAFRAVSVPEGKHTIRFYYQPELFIIGLWISVISAFVLVVISVRKLIYDRGNL